MVQPAERGQMTLGRAAHWLRRYLPAEIACSSAALGAAWLASAASESPVALALAGTWGEVLAFYIVMLIQELRERGGVGQLPAAIGALALEFGPSEALDSLALRPGLMLAGMALIPSPALGILAGKIAADVCFYAITIMSYERQRQPARRWGS
jgi:hypothetical protein